MPMANDELSVQVINDDLLGIDSRDIAAGLGIEHKNFLETVRNYQNNIEDRFGEVAFQTEASRGKNNATYQKKFALLSEAQAYAACTLSRNTPKVVDFKMRLVAAFNQAKNQMQSMLQTSLPLQIESGIDCEDDPIQGYMALLREKTKLVKSFDDALKLQCDFADFLNQYKAIQDQEKILNDMKARLKASTVSNNTSISIASASLSSSTTKPSAIPISDIDKVRLSECVTEYLKNSTEKNQHSFRRSKGKRTLRISISGIEEHCRDKGLSCKRSDLEEVLVNTGLTVDRRFNQWTYVF